MKKTGTLKGCMKEAAVLIGIKDVERIFGERGKDGIRGIVVGNAFPETFLEVKEDLTALQQGKDECAGYFSRQNVLDLYTSVKAQTKIGDNGAAEDNSLRFLRIVNQFDKIQLKEMVFSAEVSYCYSGQEDPIASDLEKIVKATRNIGMNRNRGLGSVKMKLSEGTSGEKMVIDDRSKKDGKKKISFGITNLQPLLMSAGKDDVTENYINRLKKTKKLVNVAAEEMDNEKRPEYCPKNGNQPKKLKTQFLLCCDGQYTVKEVQKEIIYHHAKHGKNKDGEEGLLYFLEAIEEGQHFAGEIIVENKYLETVKKLLKTINLRLGKSKSAQYGLCRIAPNPVVTDYEPIKAENLKKGMKVLVTLLSDGIFVNDSGIYTTMHDEVREIIGRQLGLCASKPDTKSYIQTKVITGYYTKWNLKKQEIPAIQAGSAFEYELMEDLFEYKEFIGEKNAEGFGKCRIIPLTGTKFCLEEREDAGNELSKDRILKKAVEEKTYLSGMFKKILLDKLSVHMKERAFRNRS